MSTSSSKSLNPNLMWVRQCTEKIYYVFLTDGMRLDVDLLNVAN